MTNITTNDPGRTLPPKLAEFGESLLRIADRAREVQGLEPFGEDMHVFMRAVTSAFAGADDRGSVCVRLSTLRAAWALRSGRTRRRTTRTSARISKSSPAGGLPLRVHPQRARAPWRPSCSTKAQAGLPPDFILRGSSPRSSALRLRSCGSPRSLPRTLPEATAALVEKLTGALHADELQTKAVRLALENRLAVISGGPGTGKTTTVVLILECLLEENKDLSIYLAAPTGKATSRMRQSIVAMTQGPIAGNFPRMKEVVSEETAQGAPRRVEEHTIHKWLVKKTPSGEKPTADNPLPADVLIIDEASMVDIHLAARLFEVVSESTRVIILGDKHQLAAVGPGAVFADISATDGALAASTVELKTSRRFAEGSVIAKLAAAINHDGGISSSTARTTVKRLLTDAQTGGDPDWRIAWDDAMPQGEGGYGLAPAATAWLEERFSRYTAALVDYMRVVTRPEPKADDLKAAGRALWEIFQTFRPLCAQRRGPQSVEGINAWAEAKVRTALAGADFKTFAEDRWNYPGRAVIIRSNDDILGVFNGDVGIVLPDEHGDLRAVFFDADRSMPPALMPAHDTAFAMTIHQSQGSEFPEVAVFLPTDPASGLATRELLYTGVTRTKRSVDIFGTERVLNASVENRTVRVSGLADRLAERAKAARG
ncbi:MAG: exodeoxyribonuclease V subunit alpha [Sutterella wadsworthensis]